CPLRANGSRVGHGPSEAQRTGPGVIRERGEEATPGLAGLLQRGKRQHRGHESPGDPPGPRWSDAVEELQEPEPGQLVVGFSARRSRHSRSFTWAASRKRRPPYFTKGMLRAVSSNSSRSLWW